MVATFEAEYEKLNKEQKEAVDTIDGPVMVVAGPGTGKTQILALRIANILKKTDIKGDGILCLTFTNSAVDAMRERLVRYIGEAGEKVNIFTFHSFGMKIIEEHFKVLGLGEAPKLLDETESAIFFDEIFSAHDWAELRPRGDATRYFADLRSLISLLKRERISKDDFETAIEKEIENLKNSEDNISSRGTSKGQLKQEAVKEIESLTKTKEVVEFLDLYEKAKREKNMLDYDDVLEGLVRIVETSQVALAEIRERYLYVMVDEHQDSSRVQNEFLARTWSDLESPDVFVVGDDRQLIYGFSGASIDHFKGFKKTFPGAKLIPLLENYRSTQVILDAAHALLPSVMSDAKLVSQSKERHPIKLVEANTAREEILAAAVDLKEKISKGLDPNDAAILVPKNRQVRDALETLHEEGLPVTFNEALGLFEQEEMGAFLRVLKIIESGDVPSLALSFFDKFSGVTPIEAHKFLANLNMREFSFNSLSDKPISLFPGGVAEKWIAKLVKWKEDAEKDDLKKLVQTIGRELFEESKERLVSGEDIAVTLLSLLEKRPGATLQEFVLYIEKLERYGEYIPILTKDNKGIKVLTMHASKGLEFDFVWIAHMDERSLSGGKKIGFALPESIAEKVEERDIDAVKRKLFVAITRAKRFCTLSYAGIGKKDREQELAKIISSLPEEVFQKHKVNLKDRKEKKPEDYSAITKLVAEKYVDRYVSASLLNNFYECPWKWYFRNLLQLPESPNENLEFGSLVHAALEQILNGGAMPEDKKVIKILEPWVKNRLPEIKLSRKTEEGISFKDEEFPHLKIYGKIDLIENLSGKDLPERSGLSGRAGVRVTDFKTGSARKKYDIEKLDEEGRMGNNLRQLTMYSYLLQKNPKWLADVRESRLEFLEAKNPKESLYDRVIQPKEIEMLKADIADYDKLVKSGGWTGRECHYNSYGKNTECEYCQMVEIFN